MTLDEDRLARWLHEATPEPPRTVRVDDIEARLSDVTLLRTAAPRTVPRRLPPARVWLPVLAAAVVIAVVAGVVALRTPQHNTPAHPAVTPTRVVTPVSGAPWRADLIHAGAVRGNTLTSAYGSLYAATFYGGYKLQRINAVSGDVLASSPALVGELAAPPVFARGALWGVTTPDSRSRLVLYSWDPATLKIRTRHILTVADLSTPGAGVGLTATADGSALYVGAGHSITTVDLASGASKGAVDATGVLRSLSVSPGGSRLYVLSAGGRLASINTSTAAVDPLSGLSDAHGLLAVGAGVFEFGGRPSSSVVFVPTGSRQRVTGVRSGGTPDLRSAGGVVWVGGTGRLSCVDPSDGRLLATAAVPARVLVNGVSVLDGHVYAAYTAVGTVTQPSGVIELHPPARCGLS